MSDVNTLSETEQIDRGERARDQCEQERLVAVSPAGPAVYQPERRRDLPVSVPAEGIGIDLARKDQALVATLTAASTTTTTRSRRVHLSSSVRSL